MAGCSPGKSSLAAVPAGFCRIYAFAMYLLSLTPCALNGLPHHGIQVQSQKKCIAQYPGDEGIVLRVNLQATGGGAAKFVTRMTLWCSLGQIAVHIVELRHGSEGRFGLFVGKRSLLVR